MRIKNVLWSVVLLLALGACDKEAQQIADNGRQTVVRFTSVVEGEVITRAGGGSWTAQDQIGVFMKENGKDLSSGTIVGGGDNISYITKSGDGNFQSNETSLEYPSNGSAVDFIAYYPYQSTLDNYIYKVDVADQSKPENIDLLYSNNLLGRTQTSVTGNLQFYHELSQLILNLSSSDNTDFSNLAVSISGVKTKADFNLVNGTLAVDANSETTINMRRAGNTVSAILLPVNNVSDIKLTLTLNGKSKQVSLPSTITSFEGRKKYIYSVNIKNGGTEVDPEATGYAKWRETPVISKSMIDKRNIHYINHYMPGDKNVRNYSLLYDSELKLAYWVAYPYCSYYKGTQDRTDNWQYDPEISQTLQTNLKNSYGISGYARGHQIASADRTKDYDTNLTTFYYTNSTPQLQNGLNGGIWMNLEARVRGWATDTIFVVTGAAVTTATDKNIKYFTNKNDGLSVAVPKYYYKALARKVGGIFQTIAFKLEHRVYNDSKGYMDCAISVSDLEKETGFTFFPSISPDIKATLNKSQWN